MLFGKKKKPILAGIDVGHSSIKIVELSKKDGKFYLEGYMAVPIPPAEDEKEMDNDTFNEVATTELAHALSFSRLKFKPKNAAVAIQSSVAKIKTIQIPAGMSHYEQAAYVFDEMDRLIDLPLEQTSIDFTLLNDTPDGEKTNVICSMSDKVHVERATSVVEDSGISVDIVDIESQAVCNSLIFVKPQLDELDIDPDSDQMIVIADIGETTLKLIITCNGEIVYSRDQLFGGKHLTQEISERYSLTFSEAEEAKRAKGLPEGFYSDILPPYVASLAKQILRLTSMYTSSHAIDGVSCVVLTGRGSQVAGLVDAVSESIECKAFVADPFKVINVKKELRKESLINDGPGIMIALGLALRSFDE